MDDKKYMRLELGDVGAKLTVGYCGIVLDKVQLVSNLGIGFVRMYDLLQSHRSTSIVSMKNEAKSIHLFIDLAKNSRDEKIYGQIKFFKDDLIVDMTDEVHSLPIGKDKLTGTIVTDDILTLLRQVKR